ncbi:hypothetical protein BJX99DRAFT_222814 [Aspergillus californicus]
MDRTAIVGIHFGATSTAAAYAVTDDKANLPNSTPQTHVLGNWPEAIKQARVLDQVPRDQGIQTTVFYRYSKSEPGLEVVGWDGNPDSDSDPDEIASSRGIPRPGILLTWDFKAHLFPPRDANSDEGTARVFFPPGKSVQDITVDYLTCLRRSVSKQVADQLGQSEAAHIHNKIQHRYIITIPVFWDEEYRNKFREICLTAGFDDKNITLIPKPEASLRNTISKPPIEFKSETGDNVLVISSGGHNTSATTYTLISPSPPNFQRNPAVTPSSTPTGSTTITTLFMTLAQSRITKMGLPYTANRAKSVIRYRCKREFEKQVLLGFGKTEFQLPPEVQDVPGVFWAADVGVEFECPEAGLVEGYLVFTEEEIRGCFDGAVETTVNIVAGQVGRMRDQGGEIQACLLAGGFAKCPYYSGKVREGIERGYGLGVIQSEELDCSVGVARGAVLAGIGMLD